MYLQNLCIEEKVLVCGPRSVVNTADLFYFIFALRGICNAEKEKGTQKNVGVDQTEVRFRT